MGGVGVTFGGEFYFAFFEVYFAAFVFFGFGVDNEGEDTVWRSSDAYCDERS